MSENWGGSEVTSDERTMSYLAVLGMIVLGFVAPLVVWLIAGDDPAKAYSKDQARAALNFALTQFAAVIVASVLSLIFIGFLLFPLILGWFVWGLVVGSQAISAGRPAPKYPLTFEFIH